MVASNIKVILRVRPCAKPSPVFKIHPEQGGVTFELDKQDTPGEIHNSKSTHGFRFDGILDMPVTQDDVFRTVAKPIVDDVLSGVNGTIFAYGQTGSGKTFTMTGGTERFEERGLIPRTLAYIFDAFQKGDAQYKMYISYLEIYQNAGYDLLRDDTVVQLEDLPKVTLREDEDGMMHLRGLSVNLAGSQEDALQLLIMGEGNRAVAETPMNDASTRSHCLFIIWIDSMKSGSDIVRRSKLHLVDLAGSERVSQTGVQGKLLSEAKSINLSLHYLERVIVALHAKSKDKQSHVPYRDSMMTSVLRDSLGGNCKTTMIGCIAVEPSNINESISTCGFAQRVAQITNNAKVNEELDPNLLIARLKREVTELKREVQVARKSKDGEEDVLTEEDLEQCRAAVMHYVSQNKDSKEPFVSGSVERLRASFQILRDLCYGGPLAPGVAGGGAVMDPARRAALEAEAKALRLEIAQRDKEINVLVQMQMSMKGSSSSSTAAASKAPVGDSAPAVSSAAPAPPRSSREASSAPAQGAVHAAASAPEPVIASASSTAGVGGTASAGQQERLAPESFSAKPAPVKGQAARRIPGERQAPPPLPAGVKAADVLLDKQRALEVFRQTVYQPPASFEQNKNLLKEKIAQAKALGEEANLARAGIQAAKTRLGNLRTERALTAAGNDEAREIEDGPEELAEVQEIDRLKEAYKERTSELRQVKGEIEMVQRLLEQNKIKMQKEFEAWFVELRKQTSISTLDEETKQELYERVSGTSSVRAGIPTAGVASVSTQGPSPRTSAGLPSSAAVAGGSQATSQSKADDDEAIKAYFAAVGELSKRA